MMKFQDFLFSLFGLWLGCFRAICEAQAPVPPVPPSVFDLPRISSQQLVIHRQIAGVLAAKDYATAERLLKTAIENIPHDVTAHYNLACVLARQEKSDDAFTELHKAVDLGWRDAQQLAVDPDLESLRHDARFAKVLKAAQSPPPQDKPGWKFSVKPAEPADSQVFVTEDCTAFDPTTGLLRVLFHQPETDANTPIVKGMDAAGKQLLAWSKAGTAAGNWGDFYDNHDTDHSNMNYAAFPQLTRIEYSDAAKKRGLHHGLQQQFLFNQVTIGNSSTALVRGPEWRCQGRFAITRPNGPQILALQYLSNQLYFYPEHRDHDAGHNGKDGGYGDVFPANTPYLILSQGSSGSDRAFLNAVALTLAAFRPQVKEELKKAGLLMPAVQMIFRMSNNTVAERKDYLSGKAHPTVFDGQALNVVKMIELAHSIEPDLLPPFCQIAVVEEDLGTVGRDYFDVGPREKLFDTPCAVARVVKSSQYNKRMVLSAERSRDLRDKPLKYHWKVLRGDAERIQITPLNEAGSKVELIVPYHTRQPISPGSAMESNRVDIGVFVENELYFSAPAFVSLYYLDNEFRQYDSEHRIQSIDYTAENIRNNYTDPLLDFPKDWRDEYHYDDQGNLTGWTRSRGDVTEKFTREGKLTLQQDADGQPQKTTEVRYVPERLPDRKIRLKQESVESPQ